MARRKGALKNVQIVAEQRQGRKKVTKVTGLEVSAPQAQPPRLGFCEGLQTLLKGLEVRAQRQSRSGMESEAWEPRFRKNLTRSLITGRGTS